MKARDAMLPEFCGTIDCSGLEALLLAQTPEGEGVYIAPDGELWQVVDRGAYECVDNPECIASGDDVCCDECWVPTALYRLVPIEEEP